MANKRIVFRCRECGSESVEADARVRWDKDTQAWAIPAVYESTYCPECDAEDTGCWEEVNPNA